MLFASFFFAQSILTIVGILALSTPSNIPIVILMGLLQPTCLLYGKHEDGCLENGD